MSQKQTKKKEEKKKSNTKDILDKRQKNLYSFLHNSDGFMRSIFLCFLCTKIIYTKKNYLIFFCCPCVPLDSFFFVCRSVFFPHECESQKQLSIFSCTPTKIRFSYLAQNEKWEMMFFFCARRNVKFRMFFSFFLLNIFHCAHGFFSFFYCLFVNSLSLFFILTFSDWKVPLDEKIGWNTQSAKEWKRVETVKAEKKYISLFLTLRLLQSFELE